MTTESNALRTPRYRRAVLKLSGESFSRAGERGISMEEVVDIARQVHAAQNLGCELAIVIGGGNILRGAQFTMGNVGIQEATAHYMGMLATVINGLALQDALRVDGVGDPPDDRYQDGWRGRTVHPTAGATTPGKGPHCDHGSGDG